MRIRQLPKIPEMMCMRCGAETFVPLTYTKSIQKASPPVLVHAVAKYVSCGLRVIAIRSDGVGG